VLSPTAARRVPVSSHPSCARSHPCGEGPDLAKIKEIHRVRGGDLVAAAQANAQVDLVEIRQEARFRR